MTRRGDRAANCAGRLQAPCDSKVLNMTGFSARCRYLPNLKLATESLFRGRKDEE
jgi:hypothetical protein